VVAGERDRPDIARRRAQWTKYQDRIEPERLVFIDETWTRTNMAPLPLRGPGRPHHYRFRLLALDVARLDLPPPAKCQDARRAAERHKLAEATFVGTYAR
jgi:phosphatidylethanolamine-binding protein (PEBP) family uncharacterized protein